MRMISLMPGFTDNGFTSDAFVTDGGVGATVVYGSYLKLDQKVWREFDFSTEAKLTGTIYTDKSLSTPRDLTGLTLHVRIFKRWRRLDRFNKEATIVSATGGTWEYAVARGEMPRRGIYRLELEMSATGRQESTTPVEFYVQGGPGGA